MLRKNFSYIQQQKLKMKGSLKVTIIYLSIGFLWILLSDRLSLFLFTEEQIEEIIYFQTYKGLFYVLSTGMIIFYLVKKYESQVYTKIQEIQHVNDELKAEKAQLTESKKRYKELFQISPLPMWIYDMESFRFLDVNNAAVNLYGYSKEQFLEMRVFDISEEKQSIEMESIINNFQHNGTTIFQGRFRHKKKNGEIIYVDVKSDYVGKPEDKIRLVIANNVSEFLEMQEKLRKLNQTIVQTEEKERERIAAELHDGLIQFLVAATQIIQLIKIDESDDAQIRIYEKVKSLLEDAISECRWTINDLRPKEVKTQSFKNAIEKLIEKYELLKKFEVRLSIQEELDKELDENLKFNLFRIFQENLNNTLKHSNATQVEVSLSKHKNGKLEYYYTDNGSYIDLEKIEQPDAFISLKNRLMLIEGKFEKRVSESGLAFDFLIPINGNLVLG